MTEPCPACLARCVGPGRWLCGRREEGGAVVRRCESSLMLALRFLDASGIQGRKMGYHLEDEADDHVRHMVAVSHVTPAPAAPVSMKAEFASAVMSAYGGREEK